jgi:GDPmannose 4,6-dehydratase
LHDDLRAAFPAWCSLEHQPSTLPGVSAGRALITGIGGQDGSYLAEQLLEAGYEVIGLVRPGSTVPPKNLASIPGALPLIECDLLDSASLRAAVEHALPDELYHLGAPTYVPASWQDATGTMAAIAGATATLLAAVRELVPEARVVVATSSEIFGDCGESPQHERTPMRPRSPYGVAKLAAHGLVGVMRARHGLHVSSAITYNHESPRRPIEFLPRKVTAGAAAIARGEAHELVLGDLDAVRDWSDARDVVRGLRLMAGAAEGGDYVLASGVGRTVSELVDVAFAAAGIERADRVRTDPTFIRSAEPVPLVGDASLARERLGWAPQISFEQTIAEMVAAGPPA